MPRWTPWEVYATGVAFEAVAGYGDPSVADRFVGYQIDPPSPTGEHGVGGNGPFYSPLDISLGLHPPVGVTWPEPTFVAGGGVAVEVDFQALTVDDVRASESPGGVGATYDVDFTTVSDGDHITFVVATNPLDRRAYIYTITGTAQLLQRHSIPDSVLPPPTPVTPPTTAPPPTNLPPEVISRILLEKANPGVTCELLRWNQASDLVDVFLGQKVVLNVEGVRGRLGFHNRGYVITKMRIRWRAEANPVRETLETTVTLEKIVGTLLPGAGTSDASQDAAGTGAEISLFARWDIDSAGWGSGWAA